jgi:hypothetical protein
MVFTLVSLVENFLDSYVRFWLRIPSIMRKEYTNSKALLTLILLMWNIGWASNNVSKWQMGFNLAFKGLNIDWLWSDISCIWVHITQNFILRFITNRWKGLILTDISVKCGAVVTFIVLVYTWNIFYLLITWKTDFLDLELLYKTSV